MRFTFNTGRLYTNEGQVITVDWDPASCVVLFNDHSRMISGETELSLGFRYQGANGPRNLIRALMAKYDAGQYLYSTSADDLPRGDVVITHLI